MSLISSPPVVQNPRAAGFDVSIAVSSLATARVEYGFAPDDLAFTARASHHGLVAASDRALQIPVRHHDILPPGKPIYYRVVVESLCYHDAYRLERGEPQVTPVHALRLPRHDMPRVRIVSINDTHGNLPSIRSLHHQIEELQPDLLVMNGDTCNYFGAEDAPEQILLNPASDTALAWAATRPLIFSNGNHDIRGERARELAECLAPAPESTELPFNQAIRFGPLALVVLDTGEDKPDHHPVFAGTAAYEPYRERQAAWLAAALHQPAIGEAPFKLAFTHIPLRGLPGQPDGTTLDDYARYSGDGARLWLPLLRDSGCNAIISGHTHHPRHDPPTASMPVHQFVGGGPRSEEPEEATLTIIEAEADNAQASALIRIVSLHGQELFSQSFDWTPA